MKKKLLLVLCILVYSTLQTIAQQGFIREYGKTLQNTIAYNTVQDANGDYFLAGYTSDLNIISVQGYIAKVSNTGVLLKHIAISKIDTLVSCRDIALLPNGNILVLSITDTNKDDPTNTGNYFLFSEYNSNLDFVRSFRKIKPGNGDFNKIWMRYKNNMIYCYSKDGSTSAETIYPGGFIYKFSLAGDSLAFKNYPGASIEDLNINNNNDVYITSYSSNYNAPFTLQKLNKNTLDSIKSFNFFYSPEYLYQQLPAESELQFPTDSTLLLLSINNNKVQPIKFDTAFNVVQDNIYTSQSDEFDAEANTSAMNPAKTTYLLTSNSLSFIPEVRKIDENLNIVWNKYFNVNSAWVLSSIIATNDGGCLVTATYLTANEMGIRLIKIAPDGTITSTNDLPNLKVSELLLYPNPGKEELHLKTAFQKLGGTFVLTDVSGKKVLKKNINQNETTLSTQNLKQGIYFYTYFYKNKPLETGKWVKQ